MYYDQMHYYHLYRQQNEKLISDIKKAITLKYNAINCFGELARQTQDKVIKDNILQMRKDDIKHCNQFLEIYRFLSEKSVEAKATQICSETFEKGLENVFLNEQTDSRFYLQIADETGNQAVRNIFYRAAGEDQIHANWLLYYMMKFKVTP